MEYAASFTAPELPEMGPRYPDWILLAKRAYISDRKNETVAHSHTSDGHPIQVSLFAASPPAVSHLCVDSPVCLCPGREDQYIYNPVVVFSRDDLILLNVYFAGRDMANYFIYKADPKAPSLVRIADPEPYISVSGIYNTGIVCCGGAGHFAVAALAQDYMTDMFKLSVFKSETGAWETRLLPLEPSESLCNPSALRIFCSKVIPLKGSILGWVDIWRGILLCDVLSDNPKLRYIPMPKPMPGNEGVEDDGEPTYFRDVAGCGDLIRFVEMDYEEGDTEPADPDAFIPDEWTMVTRSWKLDSREWKRVQTVKTEDIAVSEDLYGCADVLPEFFYENGILSLKKMPLGLPTLGEGNNVVYLMCKLTCMDTKGWVVGIDTDSKRLEGVSKFSAPTLGGFSTAYYPSSFSKYFNDNSAEIELNAQMSDCLAITDTEDSPIND